MLNTNVVILINATKTYIYKYSTEATKFLMVSTVGIN